MRLPSGIGSIYRFSGGDIISMGGVLSADEAWRRWAWHVQEAQAATGPEQAAQLIYHTHAADDLSFALKRRAEWVRCSTAECVS